MTIELARDWTEEYDELKVHALRSAKATGIVVGGTFFMSEVWSVGDLNIQIKVVKRLSSRQPRFEFYQCMWICNGRMVGHNNLRGKLRALHKD